MSWWILMPDPNVEKRTHWGPFATGNYTTLQPSRAVSMLIQHTDVIGLGVLAVPCVFKPGTDSWGDRWFE